MENITNFWSRFRQHPLSSVALLLLFSLLLMIPWPVGGFVKLFLGMHSPQTLSRLHWDWVLLQPSSGLFFTGLELDVHERLTVRAERVFVRFSWPRLALLETRVEGVRAPEIRIRWDVPRNTPDGSIDFAAPTESHLGQLHSVLDTLREILGEDGASIDARRLVLLMGEDSLLIRSPVIQVTPASGVWEIAMQSGSVRLSNWPLPDKLQVQLSISDSAMRLPSLQACWNGDCLDAKGFLGKGKKLSHLEFALHGIPLRPFGKLVLPDQAAWQGKAHGKFTWDGRIAHPDSWKAKGSVQLKNVQFVHWPFQRETTFANFVPQLSQTFALKRIEVPAFELAAGRVRVDSLHGQGNDMVVQGRGSWAFPQRLDFHLKGSIQGDLYESLPRLTKLALRKEENGGGFRATLSGTFAWQAIIPDSEHYGTAFRNLFR